MIRKKYRVIDRNESCVLMETIESPKKYKIRDIENDDIMITVDKELAMKTFNKYDIEEVRAEKRKMFESWLEKGKETCLKTKKYRFCLQTLALERRAD